MNGEMKKDVQWRNSNGTFRTMPPKLFKDYRYKPRPRKRQLALILYRKNTFIRPKKIRKCLTELGIAVPHNFAVRWREDKSFVSLLYQEAKKLYLRLALHVHPRTLEDDEEASKSLHSLWDKIKKLFKQRLFPVLHRRPRKVAGKEAGKEEPRCIICGKIIIRKRKRKKPKVTCSNTCWRQNWRQQRRVERKIRCANPRCHIKFITHHGAKFHSRACAMSYHKRVWRQKNLALARARARNNYQINRQSILERRKLKGGWWSRTSEENRIAHRQRAAVAQFKKRQRVKRQGLTLQTPLDTPRQPPKTPSEKQIDCLHGW